MRKFMNKKGFTLVELLAVIVILAIIMLIGVSAVLPLMAKSRKNAVLTEGTGLMDAARTAYADLSLNGMINGSPICMTLQYLKEQGYYDKSDGNYIGSVKITQTGNTYTYNYWITNRTYMVQNGTASSQLAAVVDAVPSDEDRTYNTLYNRLKNCGFSAANEFTENFGDVPESPTQPRRIFGTNPTDGFISDFVDN